MFNPAFRRRRHGELPVGKYKNRTEILDAVARQTADITEAGTGDDAEVRRLRTRIGSTLSRRRELDLEIGADDRPVLGRRPLEPSDATRELLREQLEDAIEAERDSAPLEFRRVDPRDELLSGRLAHALSGLRAGERLGPFVADGALEVFFDFFYPARRLEVVESGSAEPVLVLTEARPPSPRRGVIDVEEGTVWIRGDLFDDQLPTGSYAGLTVAGGSVEIAGDVSVGDDEVQTESPFEAVIGLELAGADVEPARGGCLSADSAARLPGEIVIAIRGGEAEIRGEEGSAEVWGQRFGFSDPDGTIHLLPELWSLVIGYEVEPGSLKAEAIESELASFRGEAEIRWAGLQVPVVAPSSTAVLGAAARGPGWWLQTEGFEARWYEDDARHHRLDGAGIGIRDRGAVTFAKGNPPLTPPVSHDFELWEPSSGGDSRVPWKQTYERSFAFFHRCDVVVGEELIVDGTSDVHLDRPVQTDGTPVAMQTRRGVLRLHRRGQQITATLAALADEPARIHRLALRNALVWTSPPLIAFAQGSVGDSLERLESGAVHVLLGLHAWGPTLPDPYVANVELCQREDSRAYAALAARITWDKPRDPRLSFHGELGPPSAIEPRPPSPRERRPGPQAEIGPDVGTTQTEGGALTFDGEAAADRTRAMAREKKKRNRRARRAEEENRESFRFVGEYLREALGPTPEVLLLDVSTNQDLLGVALWSQVRGATVAHPASFFDPATFVAERLEVRSPMDQMRVVTLPQVQWEPVRTLDSDQDIFTLGWFPTPLASATDGGPTHLGARSQQLVPAIPEDTLDGTFDAFSDGTPVAFGTTLPFGLIAAVQLQPRDVADRPADLYELSRPDFPASTSRGGLHVTAVAEGGRPDDGGISPTFEGRMRQLLNGVDLETGDSLGLSVLGSTADSGGSVETVFNNDMESRPRVPVTRFDLSGYGGSNFSQWNNPFAAYAEAAKVQFRVMVGRTALEVIKVNSVLHPWGIRVTRSITVERRSGGGVVRRDSGWQAFTPGIFDYRYFDEDTDSIEVAPYAFDAGVFRGLFGVRSIRPAPGEAFHAAGAALIPYYFDADLALDGLGERVAAIGVLGYLQTKPSGEPASTQALASLLETQGPVGGPMDAWIDFGGSGLPFRARRIEVELADDGGNPVFVAAVRGVPELPTTGAWSVVKRPAAGGEATSVSESRGVPLIRRYPVKFPNSTEVFGEPRRQGAAGDYRLADPADLFAPATPRTDYGLLQSTPTHAFLFPRPFVRSAGPSKIETNASPAFVDVIARSGSKVAFPAPGSTIELGAGSVHFDVGAGGTLALSAPIQVVGHPTPLQIAGTTGHGTRLVYDESTLSLEIQADRWSADFVGLRTWTDVVGLEGVTGAEIRVEGSTEQRSQISELRSLLLEEIEEILRYIPLVGNRGTQGPIDLGASNAKHEFKLEVKTKTSIPDKTKIASIPVGPSLTLVLAVGYNSGFDLAAGGHKAAGSLSAKLDGRVPLYTVGAATIFLVVTLDVKFSLASVGGTVTKETLDLLAFVGVGVTGQVGPFSAYAFLGVGFVMTYDALAGQTKYGGLVAFEAGVEVAVVQVKLRAELQGLVYDDGGTTKCDYSGKVKLQVDIFFIISISATYQITETVTF